MKSFNISLLALTVAILAICLSSVNGQEEGPAVKRISLRRPVGKAALKSTTTTTPAPQIEDGDEGDYGEENQENQYDDNEEYAAESSSTTTTTTEAPKKIGPVIRPFRTNDDFLNSLKRRQMNAKKNRVTVERPTPKIKHIDEDQSDVEDEPEPPKPKSAPSKSGFKANPSLSRRKPLKPARAEVVEDATAEESEQQQQEQAKPKRPTTGRLALRRRI